MMKALVAILVLATKQLNQAHGSPKMFLVETEGDMTETYQTQEDGCTDHNGDHRKEGDSWTCKDGCNTCGCGADGLISSTRAGCVINPNGEDYNIIDYEDYPCFPGSSQVRLTTGDSRLMADLKTGDSIITIMDGKLTSTKVLGFMYKKYGSGAYLTIHTEDGNKVSISGTHVMFVNNYEDVMAENVNIGDMVIIKDGNNVTKSRVINIEAGEQEGAYVPLTEHGTLLVDGVLCSSFANVPHGIAQLMAAPMRWFPAVFLSEDEGERLFVTAAKHVGYYLHKLGLLNYYHSNALQKDVEKECGLKSLEKTEDMDGPATVSTMNVDTCPIKVKH